MDANTLFIFVAVFGFVAVAGLGLAFSGGTGGGGARTAKRVQAVTGATRTERGSGKVSAAEAAGARRKQILQGLKTAEAQERKAKLTLESRIRQAGLALDPKTFWVISAVLGVVGLGLGEFLSHMFLVALGAGFVMGFGLPRWWLSFLGKRRCAKFLAEFPNAIDVIVRGIKSGLPVNDCLKVIAAESPEPIAGEFRRMVESLSGGLSIDQSMEKMYARMPLSEVRFFSIVLAIQQKTGGNLAEALGNLSTVLRSRKLMREKVKALSGEAVASASIIGCLPPGIMMLVTLVSPGYMTPLFFTPGGHMALGIGAGMMGMGTFIMKRMINFKT
ncbi:MAG: type II secretion system F family protein [Caulobacteraceae bacterium]|nr:type II secretion system F family protein [Caulobacter sp.]